MQEKSKRGIKTIGCAAVAVVFGGGGLFILSLFAMLFGVSLYLQYAVGVCIVAVLAAGVARVAVGPSKTARRRIAAAVAVVWLAAAGYAGFGWYQAQIPGVSERNLLLHEYQPFANQSKAVTLDESSSLRFTPEQRLRLDGATALYPVYAGFVQAVYPEGEYPIYDDSEEWYAQVTCSNTVNAYERLIEGKTDMIFVAEPSEAQLALAAQMGYQLHLTPIGREAFVFFVNSKNPVSGLSIEQIQGIYTGEITNWKQVGGKNWKIRPFQRAENSGSQTALQKLMAGLPLLTPEKEERVSAMDGIIHQVANYRNYKNAIGFSFRYYATEMVTSDEIRLLSLNGVAPTKETIRDGSYPIASAFYAVTASPIGEPAPQESNADMQAFLQWILSPQGQSIVEKTGYVPL